MYYFSKTLNTTFENALDLVIEALKTEGFGVLTQINIKDTLKKKIDVDFRKYVILGACNPQFAHQALESEEQNWSIITMQCLCKNCLMER